MHKHWCRDIYASPLLINCIRNTHFSVIGTTELIQSRSSSMSRLTCHSAAFYSVRPRRVCRFHRASCRRDKRKGKPLSFVCSSVCESVRFFSCSLLQFVDTSGKLGKLSRGNSDTFYLGDAIKIRKRRCRWKRRVDSVAAIKQFRRRWRAVIAFYSQEPKAFFVEFQAGNIASA